MCLSLKSDTVLRNYWFLWDDYNHPKAKEPFKERKMEKSLYKTVTRLHYTSTLKTHLIISWSLTWIIWSWIFRKTACVLCSLWTLIEAFPTCENWDSYYGLFIFLLRHNIWPHRGGKDDLWHLPYWSYNLLGYILFALSAAAFNEKYLFAVQSEKKLLLRWVQFVDVLVNV